MIPMTEMLQHYRALAAGSSPALPIQKKAAMHLQALDLPRKKDEAWHYTPVTPLLEYRFTAANEDLAAPDRKQVEKFLTGDPEDIRIVLVNGSFHAGLSSIPDNINGLQVSSVRTAINIGTKNVINRLGTLSGEGTHLFSALNTAVFTDGVFIRIGRDTIIDKPIEILYLSAASSNAPIFQPRNLIVLEENATATVAESCVSSNENPCFNNSVSEIFLGKGATLNHPRLQNENRQTRHLASLFVQLGKDSHYQCTTTDLGATWTRTEFNVEFSGENAECVLNGFYLAGDDQITTNHLNITHAVPGCSSREFFKGILKGNGKAVFDGNVIVEKDAQKTDAHLKNANLMLSRRAEIDTRPVLQINADDVQCSHGTTVGQIDPEILFYLRARGIPEPEAHRLVCLGFAKEVLQGYSWKPMRERIETILESRLAIIENIED